MDDGTDPGPYPANTNVVCVYCERVLRITSPGKKPERESLASEIPPSEQGQIRAAQQRADTARGGRPVDNPPPRNPNGRPPPSPPGGPR